MASTYSTNLGIELIGTGEQSGTWGTTTNNNLGILLEQAISGYVTQAVSTGTDTTITIPNGASGVARNMYLELTGTGGANTNLIVPANKKLFLVFNNTSSGAVTVKVSGQTGVSVPNAAKMFLVNNGTDIVSAVSYFAALSTGAITAASLALTTPLAVTSGGTGSATVTANNVIIGNSGGTGFSSVAPGTSGNVLSSNGTAWVSSSAFVSGMIIMWSGSIATIPTGWFLCNGSNSTPDLRDRMVIGAGSTYAVNATGGSATTTLITANLASHTHTYSSTSGNTSVDHNHTYSGTTSGQSVTHNHVDSGHSHTIDSPINLIGGTGSFALAGGVYPYEVVGSTDTGVASIGNASVDHNHTFSGTSSGQSVTHNHSVSGTSDATGSGTAATTISPYYALAYIMKS